MHLAQNKQITTHKIGGPIQRVFTLSFSFSLFELFTPFTPFTAFAPLVTLLAEIFALVQSPPLGSLYPYFVYA